jgi:hypothetical protein
LHLLKGKVPRDLGTKVPFINQLHSAIFPEWTSLNFSCLVLVKTLFFLLHTHMHTSTKSKMYWIKQILNYWHNYFTLLFGGFNVYTKRSMLGQLFHVTPTV